MLNYELTATGIELQANSDRLPVGVLPIVMEDGYPTQYDVLGTGWESLQAALYYVLALIEEQGLETVRRRFAEYDRE